MDELSEFLDMPNWSVTNAFRVLTRRKPLEDSTESKLAKVLSAFDLTALGIGSTLGVGVYVLAGEVSKSHAGPAVVLSFLIAAIASIFAGLCYAEFGARVPKAGSAYIYSYVTIGEFIAFLIGWNLILEYAIGSASVVKGLSTYLDSLCGYAMRDFLAEHLPMNVQGLSAYPDLFAFIVTILFSWAIASGAKESTRVNNIFTMLNLGVVLFVIIAGLFKVSSSNWSIPKSQVPEGYGNGGFMPYGVSGVIKGAAVCFYGFIGFDCIATAGEEAKNPKKSIPFAVIVSLGMIFLAYFGVSTVLTMMLPYYAQDESAPLPHVFRIYGWHVAEYVVTIGAMFGLCASLMGAMFPLPRIVFAMSNDGLLFKCLGEISTKYKTPFKGTMLTGLLCGILAAIFNLSQLVNMMSIGTLLAYSMVASCVLMLRYEVDERRDSRILGNGRIAMGQEQPCALWRRLLNLNGQTISTRQTARIVTGTVTMFSIWSFVFSQFLTKFEEDLANTTQLDVWLLILASIPLILMLYIISRQPTSGVQLSFKVPLVPWVPGVSILINIYLMIKLDILTWVRFSIWISIGLAIYLSYSIRHSRLRQREQRNNSIAMMRDASDTALLSQERSKYGNEVPLILMHSSS
ncbi:cationic amino acid transporter 2 isoform X1 [Drosophila nasuta]|uniref:Cationic amino acid transporter 2 isoform X1 n=2 Tax=Drosophila albomicans TaxID=7291 RepID=A0A6P8X019_DROAB|nr:cationic amino acid transporter 2 isoform X1 [Drosophila albomicans]XP_060656299.1 cationic amino acid transporter 2 isoform X1 [Drosophila nasuta]